MPAPHQTTTKAIVLRRVNYGEADRILTLLTPDQGKLSAIAKGARRAKSKLAGGIELFSVSEISFIKGKNDIDTLTSTRLIRHFNNIVTDLPRTNQAYDFIKIIDKTTEDKPEELYFNLLKTALAALDDKSIDPLLTQLWFNLRLLKVAGHAPDLFLDSQGDKLAADKKYEFDLDKMKFFAPKNREGNYDANAIKYLRLAANSDKPHLLARVGHHAGLTDHANALVNSIRLAQLRV